MLFSAHCFCSALCSCSCHFTHPAAFLSLLHPFARSPLFIDAFPSSFLFSLHSFAHLLFLVASRRGFLNSLSLSAFATKRVFLLFSPFNVLPIYIFSRAGLLPHVPPPTAPPGCLGTSLIGHRGGVVVFVKLLAR